MNKNVSDEADKYWNNALSSTKPAQPAPEAKEEEKKDPQIVEPEEQDEEEFNQNFA